MFNHSARYLAFATADERACPLGLGVLADGAEAMAEAEKVDQ